MVDTYGVFPQQPAPIPASTPSYIIDEFPPPLDGTSFIGTLLPWLNPLSPHDRSNAAVTLICPWVRARVSLGLMARWKALYIFLGYDKAWSVLQDLRIILNDPDLPADDGTSSRRNKSQRELVCKRTLEHSKSDSRSFLRCLRSPQFHRRTLPLAVLMIWFDIIAKGNWAGPAAPTPVSRPASFQKLLAAAVGVDLS